MPDINKNNRRDFLATILAGGAAVASGGLEKILEAADKPVVDEMALARMHVYYGARPTNAKDKRTFDTTIAKDMIVVEPGNFPIAPNDRSYFYFSTTGVNTSNASVRGLGKSLQDKGLLLGVEDPGGPGTQMVDLRKPEARKVMADFLVSKLKDSKFEGVMLDAIASAEIVEKRDPVKYKGLAEAATTLVEEVAEKLHAIKPKPRKVIVNGILENDELMQKIGKSTDMFMCESQCSLSGNPRTENDNGWSAARLTALAKGAVEGKHKVGVIFVEPGAGNNAQKVHDESSAIAKKIMTAANEAVGETALVGGGLFVSKAADYQTFSPQPAAPKGKSK